MNHVWQAVFVFGGIGAFLIGMRLLFNHLEHRLAASQPRSSLVLDPDQAEMIATHHWGKSVRIQLIPVEYEGDLHCLSCRRQILPGQWFWETPLVDSGGLSFQTCLSCQPGDAEAMTHGA